MTVLAGLPPELRDKLVVEHDPPWPPAEPARAAAADKVSVHEAVAELLGPRWRIVEAEADGTRWLAVEARDGGAPRLAHPTGRAALAYARRIIRSLGQRVPRDDTLAAALELLRDLAEDERLPRLAVGIRTVRDRARGVVAIDLADGSGRAIVVSPEGWRLASELPDGLGLRSASTLRPLPEPVRGAAGALARYLERCCRVPEAMRDVLAGWLAGAAVNLHPLPLLFLYGPPGAAKTTTMEMLRRLIDPSHPPHASLPHDARDLASAVQHRYVLAFDNVGSISAEASDHLCRIVTGAGFEARRLYTDDELHAVGGARPIMMTAVGEALARPDLRDRGIMVELAPIGDGERLDRAEVEAEAEALAPAALGELLDIAALGLGRWNAVERPPEGYGRMADFERWLIACELAEARRAYRELRAEMSAAELDNSPVASALLDFLGKAPDRRWRGTWKELLAELDRCRGEVRPPRGWPETARSLASAVRYHRAALERAGVTIGHARRAADKAHVVVLARPRPGASTTSATSATTPDNPCVSMGYGVADGVADRSGDLPPSATTVRGGRSPTTICHPICHHQVIDSSWKSGSVAEVAEVVDAPGEHPGDPIRAERLALAARALDRALALFPEAVGREPRHRELWELACRRELDRIRAKFEARAREVPA